MNRLILHVEAILIFFASIGFYQIIHEKDKFLIHFNIDKKLTYIRRNTFPKFVIAILFLLFVSSEGYAFFEIENDFYLTEDYQDFYYLQKVFDWVEINVKEPTRIYYQSTFDDQENSGISKSWVMAYANYFTTKPSLGTWSGQMPYPTYRNITTFKENGEVIFGKSIVSLNDRELACHLKAFNSKYIVINSNAMKGLLNNSSLFNIEASFGRFVIYSLKDYDPGYVQAAGESSFISNLTFKNDFIEFDAFNATSVNISVQYHPYWKACVDGKPARLEKDGFNLMYLDIPDGIKKRRHIQMVFEKEIT